VEGVENYFSCIRHSFAPGTLVLMADGSKKPIEKVKPNEKVLATDPVTGKTTKKSVVATHINLDVDLTDLVIGEGAVLQTTTHHPFWSKDQSGWVNAADLEQSESLAALDGSPLRVSTVTSYSATRVMYDLTVDTVHTYYVLAGNTPVLVHNCGDAAKHSVDSLADSLDENTYFHYTSESGHAAIMESGLVKANRKNVAYFTQDMVSPGDANGVLFAGNPSYVGRGTHVIAFRMRERALQKGTQANEVVHVGSFRFGPDDVIYHGANPFK
jgi:hypothetical protein